MNGIDKNKEELYSKVVEISKLETFKIKNIYVFGSRVYGTHTLLSDYDMVVIATSLYANHEIFEDIYNIHVTTPDIFKEQIRQYDMHSVECIFAPHEAQIYSKLDFKSGFSINKDYLKKMVISQSTWAWAKGQKRIERGNILGGCKSLFHSFRIIDFGGQLLQYGEINNFSSSNDIWKNINDCNYLDWESYQNTWMPLRKEWIKAFKKE